MITLLPKIQHVRGAFRARIVDSMELQGQAARTFFPAYKQLYFGANIRDALARQPSQLS